MDVRDAWGGPFDAIERLYRAAFPDEDLSPLVGALMDDPGAAMTLAAVSDGGLTGHAVFSFCAVTGRPAGQVALLGPLAVTPDRQGRGIGSALVRAGLDRLTQRGTGRVLVLGDPGYYARFGFRADDRISAPYDLPEDWAPAWQSLSLPGDDRSVRGRLAVPAAWRAPDFWR